MGSVKENIVGVSLTERCRVTLQKVHFECMSGWVVSPRCRRAWKDDRMIVLNSNLSRSLGGWLRRRSKLSSVRVHLC